LIRDERIVAFSLDLPEQQRFAAVRAAIGGIIGPDYSERTSALVIAANYVKEEQERRFAETQAELSRTLTELTEARSLAERSTDIAEALRIINSIKIELPKAPGDRAQVIRGLIANRKQVASMRSQTTVKLLAGLRLNPTLAAKYGVHLTSQLAMVTIFNFSSAAGSAVRLG
jgi:hypothetical protein